jgi:hypothetical protein
MYIVRSLFPFRVSSIQSLRATAWSDVKSVSMRTASDCPDTNVTTVGFHNPTEPSGSVAFVAMGGVKNRSARRGDNDASDGKAHYEANLSGSSTRCRLKKAY